MKVFVPKLNEYNVVLAITGAIRGTSLNLKI